MIRSDPAVECSDVKMLEVAEAETYETSAADSDSQLMWRLRGRDEEALAALYDRHAGVAFGLALRMLQDRSIAEEVVQDAFLSLWRLAASYAPERASVRSWLLVMVRSRAIDRLRPASARARPVPLDDQPQLTAVNDTWRAAADSLRRKVVQSALTQLPSEQVQVLELAYFGGLSQSEIADRARLPIGTVKSRTRLALDRLRQLLAETIAAEEPDS